MSKLPIKIIVSIVFLLLSAQYCLAQHKPKLTVKIDPRFENISIFYFLATLDTVDIKPTPSIYFKNVESHFAGFRDHASVKWYRDLETWDGFDLPSLGYYLSDSAPFEIKLPYKAHYLRSSEQAQFLQALNTFTKDFNTKAFLRKSQPLYLEVTRKVENQIQETGILTSLKDFYGNDEMKEVVLYLDLLIIKVVMPFLSKQINCSCTLSI